jgi:hypothetical protein
MRCCDIDSDVAKTLVESLFCAFSKFLRVVARALRGKTSVTSRR